MPELFDTIAANLARGHSRRQVLKDLGIAFLGSLGLNAALPLGLRAAGCYARCETKCTGVDGKLNFSCFRACVNSDNANCGHCGNACANGTSCQGGKCVGTSTDCSTDRPSAATITAARSALANGATDVPLSPSGCYRYQISTLPGQVSQEQLVVQNRAVFTIQHSGKSATAFQDNNGDGFNEWQATGTIGATEDVGEAQFTNFSPSTRLPLDRTTYTSDGTTVTVLLERADDSGNLQPLQQFTKPLATDAVALQSEGTCSPDQCDPAQLLSQLHAALDQGVACLRDNNENALADRLMIEALRNAPTVSCASLGVKQGRPVDASTLPPFPAWLGFMNWLSHRPVQVNQDSFCTYSDQEQLGLLFHELMHLDIPHHEPEKEIAPNRDQVDQIYACQAFCFKPHSAVTQCTCAACLQTNKCDDRCSTSQGFLTCGDDFGARCPCPKGPDFLRWYPTCLDCLIACPSGTACFGYHFCFPEKGACTIQTCP